MVYSNSLEHMVQYRLKGLQHLHVRKMCVVCVEAACNYTCVKLTDLVVTRIRL